MLLAGLVISSCQTSKLITRTTNSTPPSTYTNASSDTLNDGVKPWKEIFTDPNLVMLIDSALSNNQELQVFLQEMTAAKSEVGAKQGEYLPMLGIYGASGFDKVGEYTREGAVEKELNIRENEAFPEPVGDFKLGLKASWEIDIWRKLRNARKSALMNYLGTVEGKNFLVTNLVAEISNNYYELVALDNQYKILQEFLSIQEKVLQIVKLQKKSAKVTELAVQRFQAEVYKNRSLLFEVQQDIVEVESEINRLVGRYPQTVVRTRVPLVQNPSPSIHIGVPAQLIWNRPDVREAEYKLQAAKLDVKSARANFYPRLALGANYGLSSFTASTLLESPASLAYGLAGDLFAPLVNRKAIKANYQQASAKQIARVYEYEQSVMKAFTEVFTQMKALQNISMSLEFKSKQVEVLSSSIKVAEKLYQSARADYVEVLLTQRESLEATMELVETKKIQLQTGVNLYKALGGGWR